MENKLEKNTKTWKTVGTFKTYAAADLYRKSLVMMDKHKLVKVKRNSEEYIVKAWDPPEIKEKVKKPKKHYPKGKNNKRRQKNDNKKIRVGYEQE